MLLPKILGGVAPTELARPKVETDLCESPGFGGDDVRVVFVPDQ